MDPSQPRVRQISIPADLRSTNGMPDVQEYRDFDPGRHFEHLASRLGYYPYLPIRIMAFGPPHARIEPGTVRTRPGDLLHLWTRLDVDTENAQSGPVGRDHNRKRVHLYGSNLDSVLEACFRIFVQYSARGCLVFNDEVLRKIQRSEGKPLKFDFHRAWDAEMVGTTHDEGVKKGWTIGCCFFEPDIHLSVPGAPNGDLFTAFSLSGHATTCWGYLVRFGLEGIVRQILQKRQRAICIYRFQPPSHEAIVQNPEILISQPRERIVATFL